MLSVEAVDLYYGASHALRRVSLTAKKGEVTCILGRNGVGKTSLLRAIFGLHSIRSGHIRWEDRILNSLSPHERAIIKRLFYVDTARFGLGPESPANSVADGLANMPN